MSKAYDVDRLSKEVKKETGLKLFNDYYNSVLKKATLANMKQVIASATSGDEWLNLKVFNAINRGEYKELSFEDVMDDITKGNEHAVSKFMKPPTKQNLSEATQSWFSLNVHGIKFDKPAGHFYVIDGEVIKKAKKMSGGKVKSVDFFSNVNGVKYVITAKLTNGDGGAQDGSYQEIVRTLREYDKGVDAGLTESFVALVDGTHFTTSRVKSLRDNIKHTDRVFVVSSDDLSKIN